MADKLLNQADSFVLHLLEEADADCVSVIEGVKTVEVSEDSLGSRASLTDRVAVLKAVTGYLNTRSGLAPQADVEPEEAEIVQFVNSLKPRPGKARR